MVVVGYRYCVRITRIGFLSLSFLDRLLSGGEEK